MKVTIYKLLGMVKDGKLKDGTKIRCSDFPATYVYKNGTLGFYGAEEFIELTLRDILENINYANYEILEEEKKIPEKLEILNATEHSKEVYYENYSKEEISLDIETLQNWVNRIIDYLDYLKSKGDE